MKPLLYILIFGFSFLGYSFSKNSEQSEIYKSGSLIINKVSNHVYEHTSFLQTESFGKVPCNGMIVANDKEAVVFDTPADNKTSKELIDWITNELHCKIKAIIPTHFHADCLGGLDEFHKNGVPSYANNLTIKLAKLTNAKVPQNGFDKLLELKVGDKKVIAEFIGEGHTKDNIIGYFPDEKVMFGGCLIKEVSAGKGYLGDANVAEWSKTVAKLKKEYPKTKIVIPGHGKYGGTELLDYTIELFEPNNNYTKQQQ